MPARVRGDQLVAGAPPTVIRVVARPEAVWARIVPLLGALHLTVCASAPAVSQAMLAAIAAGLKARLVRLPPPRI